MLGFYVHNTYRFFTKISIRMKKIKVFSTGFAFCLGLLLQLSLLGTFHAAAQTVKAGWVEPVKGIQVLPIFHASLELKWADKIVLFDPSFDEAILKRVEKPDIILLTDIHGDHLNPEILAKLETVDLPIIAPQAVFDKLPATLQKQTKILSNGQTSFWKGIRIQAVAMYNLPGNNKQIYHTKGRGNGYVLTMGGKKVYVSGDTEAVREMRSLKGIDLAFVCMNLPYTMDVDQAASGVLAFKPKVVIPYHYRGGEGLSDIQKFKTLVQKGNPGVRVELLDFYKK